MWPHSRGGAGVGRHRPEGSRISSGKLSPGTARARASGGWPRSRRHAACSGPGWCQCSHAHMLKPDVKRIRTRDQGHSFANGFMYGGNCIDLNHRVFIPNPNKVLARCSLLNNQRRNHFLTSGVSWIVPMPEFGHRAGRIQCTHSPFIHAIAYSTRTTPHARPSTAAYRLKD